MDKIIWTDNALQDLIDIGDYISKDSEKYAQLIVYLIQLMNTESTLKEFIIVPDRLKIPSISE